MTTLVDGHQYKLNTLDGDLNVLLTFVQRIGDKYPGNKCAHPGTTIQEVCRVLIDRMKYVNNQTPCPETEACIQLARRIIYTLELRAARIHDRPLLIDSHAIELEPTCAVCGHVGHNCKEPK